MSNTFHHGCKRDIKAPRNPEGYSGTPFVGCWMQEGRAFVKKTEHRMIRRHGKKVVRQAVAAMVEVAPLDTASRIDKYYRRETQRMLQEMINN